VNPPHSSEPLRRAAEEYEQVFVPATFAPWARDLVTTAALCPGERVLDVACGTGVVARHAAPLVGAGGRVVGVDSSPAMLAVARARPAPVGAAVEWREADAAALSLPEGAFDVVLCQHGLQFMADRPLALREMRRVLRADGRLALSVWRSSAGVEALWEVVARHLGAATAAAHQQAFALADGDALAALVAGAGFRAVAIATRALPARYPRAAVLIEHQLGGRFAATLDALDEERRAALLADARRRLAPFEGPAGLVFSQEAQVVVARR
jgi:ubiquinone/menaquinone biosynthesis C-methylase UbiE